MTVAKVWNPVTFEWEIVATGAKGDQGIQGPKGDQGIQGIQGLPGLSGLRRQVPAGRWAGCLYANGGGTYTVPADWTFGNEILLAPGTYTKASCWVDTSPGVGAGVRLGLARMREDGSSKCDILATTTQIPAETSSTNIEADFVTPVTLTDHGLYYLVFGCTSGLGINTHVPLFGLSVSNISSNAYSRVVRYTTADSYTAGFNEDSLMSYAGTGVTWRGAIYRAT